MFASVLHAVTSAVAPTDFIDELWVEDIVHLVVEARRLRALQARLLASYVHVGLGDLLDEQIGRTKAGPLVRRWSKGQPKARAEVAKALSRAGLTMEHAEARTLELKLDAFERFDRMTTGLEARRHLVLRELDRHRAAVAARLLAVADDIEDGAYAEVADEEPPTAAAA